MPRPGCVRVAAQVENPCGATASPTRVPPPARGEDRAALVRRHDPRPTSRRRPSGRPLRWAAASSRSGPPAARRSARSSRAGAAARRRGRAPRRRRSHGCARPPRTSRRRAVVLARSSRRSPVGCTCRRRSPVLEPSQVVVDLVGRVAVLRGRRPARRRHRDRARAASKTAVVVSRPAGRSRRRAAPVDQGREVLGAARPPAQRPRWRARAPPGRRAGWRCAPRPPADHADDREVALAAASRWWSGCCWPSAGRRCCSR